MTAYFMTAIAVTGVVGSLLSGTIMEYLHGVGGLKGWQWLFLVEGAPSVVFGFLVLVWLPDGPEQASWLTEPERAGIIERLGHEQHSARQRHTSDLLRALTAPRVWMLICLYFTVAVGANASGAWLPKLIKGQFEDAGLFRVGVLTALPHTCAVVAMTLLAAHSDHTGERRLHVAFAALVAAAGWFIAYVGTSPFLVLAGLCLAQAGMMSFLPCFWAIPPTFLTGAAAAGGIALINSVANIGGIVGPNILGQFGPLSMAGIMLAGSVLALCVRREARPG
jgi:ACS family tartrate transporter-like MFS transporter